MNSMFKSEMKIVMGVGVSHVADGQNISESQIKERKKKLILELTGSAENTQIYVYSEFEEQLQLLSLDQLEMLSEIKSIFTTNCSFSDRNEIIKCLRGVSQDQWKEISLEVNAFLPIDAPGSQVISVTRILTSIVDLSFRKKLIKIAIQFMNFEMPSQNRVNLLSDLSKLSNKELLKIDNAGEEMRASFKDRIKNSKSKL